MLEKIIALHTQPKIEQFTSRSDPYNLPTFGDRVGMHLPHFIGFAIRCRNPKPQVTPVF